MALTARPLRLGTKGTRPTGPDKMSHLLSGEHRLFSLLSAAYEGLFGLPRADLQADCGEREATCR